MSTNASRPTRQTRRVAAEGAKKAAAGLGALSTTQPPRLPPKPAAAIAELVKRDPVIAVLHARFGPPILPKPTEAPFSNLVRSITHQQIANTAARAISSRLEALLGEVSPHRVLEVAPAELRNVGLSWNKVASIRDLAAKAADGIVLLDPKALARMSDAEIAEELITVRGVGRWSAEMFLMFQLRRPDVWPTGDLSVRQGYSTAWEINVPTPKQLDEIGDVYRPYRSLVAWYCWQISWDSAAAARETANTVT